MGPARQQGKIDFYTVQHQQILRQAKCSKDDLFLVRVLLLMSTYSFRNTEKGLISILRECDGLNDEPRLFRTLDTCVKEGLLIKKNVQGVCLLIQTKACREQFIERYLPTKEARQLLDELRESYSSKLAFKSIGLFGGGTGQNAYLSRVNELRRARREILIPMLNADVTDEVADTLKEQADQGVKIKILLAHPKLAQNLRVPKGNVVEKWVDALDLKAHPTIEIRMFHREEDSVLYSNLIVDDTAYFNIFDPGTELAFLGTVFQLEKGGRSLNLIRILVERFYHAWSRATPVGWPSLLWRLYSPVTFMLLGMILLLTLYFWTSSETLRILLVNLMVADATSFVTIYYQKIRTYISRAVEKMKGPGMA